MFDVSQLQLLPEDLWKRHLDKHAGKDSQGSISGGSVLKYVPWLQHGGGSFVWC